MASPQTKSRENKIANLKQAMLLIADLLTANKTVLDGMDYRHIKKIVAQLLTWKGALKATT